MTAAHARRKYSSYSQAPLLPVCREITRSRLGTNAINCPPELGLNRVRLPNSSGLLKVFDNLQTEDIMDAEKRARLGEVRLR